MAKITISLPHPLLRLLDHYIEEQKAEQLLYLTRSGVLQLALSEFLARQQKTKGEQYDDQRI